MHFLAIRVGIFLAFSGFTLHSKIESIIFLKNCINTIFSNIGILSVSANKKRGKYWPLSASARMKKSLSVYRCKLQSTYILWLKNIPSTWFMDVHQNVGWKSILMKSILFSPSGASQAINWSIGRSHSLQVKHRLWYTFLIEIIFSASKTLPLHLGQEASPSSEPWIVKVSTIDWSKNLGLELPL